MSVKQGEMLDLKLMCALDANGRDYLRAEPHIDSKGRPLVRVLAQESESGTLAFLDDKGAKALMEWLAEWLEKGSK